MPQNISDWGSNPNAQDCHKVLPNTMEPKMLKMRYLRLVSAMVLEADQNMILKPPLIGCAARIGPDPKRD